MENETFVERRRTKTFFSCRSSILIELKFGHVGFCEEKKTGKPGEKLSEQGEYQQQTQPTYDTTPESHPDQPRSQTQGKGPGDELSGQCDIPARAPSCPENGVIIKSGKDLC